MSRTLRQLVGYAIVAITITAWGMPLAAEPTLDIQQLTLHKVSATAGSHQGRAGIQIVEPGPPRLN